MLRKPLKKLSRALAVLRVNFQVNGNSQFQGSAPKNYRGDKDKILLLISKSLLAFPL